jgi:hypothetical protein
MKFHASSVANMDFCGICDQNLTWQDISKICYRYPQMALILQGF